MPLTNIACKNADPGAKVRKLSDGGGLQLWIQPTGGRQWRFAYRFLGKQKVLAIGPYPIVSLNDAREAARKAKRQIAEGNDPSAIKRESRLAQAAAATTFQTVAEEYLKKLRCEGRAESTMKKVEWLLSLAYPDIGSKKIADISAPDILVALRRSETRGRYETARRMRSTIGSVFRYAVATARAEADPTSALQGALITKPAKPRPAIVEPAALGALLREIDGYNGQLAVRAGLQLMAYLFPRPGELRRAEWSEFDFDKRVWSIPAEKMKMRRPHRTPLSKQAINILRHLHCITGAGVLVFPSIRSELRPISDNAMTAALRNLGYTNDEIVPHGFRATASTLLNESGKWNPDAIERQLAHIESNDVRRAYARGEHWDERVKMMNWWANYLDKLRDDKTASNPRLPSLGAAISAK